MSLNPEQINKLEYHDEVLFGRNGNPGIAHKVHFMWKIHLWLVGLFGTVAGTIIGFGLHWIVSTGKI